MFDLSGPEEDRKRAREEQKKEEDRMKRRREIRWEEERNKPPHLRGMSMVFQHLSEQLA